MKKNIDNIEMKIIEMIGKKITNHYYIHHFKYLF